MRLLSMMLSALLLSSAAPWVLAWSDEFNGAKGSSPDPAKWVFDIGGGGWGKKELESYTSRPVNAKQLDGNLVITAAKEDYTGLDNVARPYTSARLKTLGKFSQTYGRFEARMQLPLGKGIWSAFWMLGVNNSVDGWPKAGGIDIMENIGDAESFTALYMVLDTAAQRASRRSLICPPVKPWTQAFTSTQWNGLPTV